MDAKKNPIEGKYVIIFGERDDTSGDVIEKICVAAGGQIYFSSTSCFVWTAAGSADMADQEKVETAADTYGKDNVVIVVGLYQPFNVSVLANTFMKGDPAGVGARKDLGVKTYHIIELKAFVPEDVWQENMGMKELEIEAWNADAEEKIQKNDQSAYKIDLNTLINIVKTIRGE